MTRFLLGVLVGLVLAVVVNESVIVLERLAIVEREVAKIELFLTQATR